MLAVGSKQLQRVRGEVEMSSVHRQDLVCSSSADYGKLLCTARSGKARPQKQPVVLLYQVQHQAVTSSLQSGGETAETIPHTDHC